MWNTIPSAAQHLSKSDSIITFYCAQFGFYSSHDEIEFEESFINSFSASQTEKEKNILTIEKEEKFE